MTFTKWNHVHMMTFLYQKIKIIPMEKGKKKEIGRESINDQSKTKVDHRPHGGNSESRSNLRWSIDFTREDVQWYTLLQKLFWIQI